MARRDFHKVVIGRSETMDVLDTNMHQVPVKTDTGAYRSAIHASNIQLDEVSGTLSFKLLGNHPICGNMATAVTTKDFTTARVENSFGHSEERFEVKLKVKIGPKVFKARFTLADRSKKIYPVLLGRKLLNNRFLVDPAETSVDRVTLKQAYGVSFPDDEEEGRETV